MLLLIILGIILVKVLVPSFSLGQLLTRILERSLSFLAVCLVIYVAIQYFF